MSQVKLFEKEIVQLHFDRSLLNARTVVSPLKGTVVSVDSKEITVQISPKTHLIFSAQTFKQIVNKKQGGWRIYSVIGRKK